jgi:hypothetical protein
MGRVLLVGVVMFTRVDWKSPPSREICDPGGGFWAHPALRATMTRRPQY